MKKLIAGLLLMILMHENIFASEIESPNVAASGAVLMDFETGRVLWEKDMNKPLAMASTTKIMTAIIALENGNMSDIVTVSKRASRAPEVKMRLSEGEKIKLDDLMYALMLQSYNDAAVAIAEHVGGSVEEFCNLMTQKAKDLGAENTVFRTPNGLDLDDHHSTAYDMALITRYALSNPRFMEIINTPNKTAVSDRGQYNLRNLNRLLNEYEGANGVKTGFTGMAGQCFVGSAKRGDMQLISVVLASGWGSVGKEQKWIDTKRMLDYGFDNYKYMQVVKSGDFYAKVDVNRSREETVGVICETGFKLPVNENERKMLYIKSDYEKTVNAPVKKGDSLGKLTVYIGDDKLTDINLIADKSIERHDLETSLKKILTKWLEMGTNREINMEEI
ncbi:MAG: D-alanyl-D-alanine carboxypeptidase [Clostridiales bacterium]|nr:D-alanyl-D-alanine carboxypeptidase [Clostridiales bacterium]